MRAMSPAAATSSRWSDAPYSPSSANPDAWQTTPPTPSRARSATTLTVASRETATKAASGTPGSWDRSAKHGSPPRVSRVGWTGQISPSKPISRHWRTATSAGRPPTTTRLRGASSRRRWVPTTGSGSERAEHRPRDDVALDLARAVPDPLDPGVPPEPLDRELVHQAHAAVDLHRLVGDPPERLGREDLGHRRVLVGHRALVELPRGSQREQLGGLELGGHVREREPDALEPADRLSELHPLGGPPGRHLQHPTCAADAAGGDGQAARTEPLTHQLET